MKQIMNYKFYETKAGFIRMVEPNGNSRLLARDYAIQLYNELKQKKEAQAAKSGGVFAIITKFALWGDYDNCSDCEVTKVRSEYVNMFGLTNMSHVTELTYILMKLASHQSYSPCEIVVILSNRKWTAAELEKLNYYKEFGGYGDDVLAKGNVMPTVKKYLYNGLPTFRYQESTWHTNSEDCHSEAYTGLREKIQNMLNK